MIARFVFLPAVLAGIIISLSACADSLGVLSTETPTAVIAGQEAVAAQIMTATVAPTTSAAETLAARPTAFPSQVPFNQPESTNERFGLFLNGISFTAGQTVANLENGLVFIYPAPDVDGAYGAGEVVDLAFYPDSDSEVASIIWGGVDRNTYRTAAVTLDRLRQATLEVSFNATDSTEAPPSTGGPTPTANTPLRYTLIATASPDIGGTVAGTGAYAAGTSVMVNASPVSGYIFTGWSGSGACVGTVNPCTVNMAANKRVIARFSREFTLTALASPDIGGTVTGGGAHPPGASVPVIATPNTGYTLTRWTGTGSGACSGTALRCLVTMDEDKTVTANFSRALILTASTAPVSGGTVTGGGSYPSGTSVPVVATPNPGYTLTGWTGSGACSGTGPTCTVTMNRDKTVTVNFSIVQFTLTTSAAPLTSGTVFGDGSYPYGSAVEVRAAANAGYGLASWSGACASVGPLTNPCTVTMDGDKSVTANFSLPGFTLTTSYNPPAGGTISASGRYASGTIAGVVASPNAGYILTGWTGTGSGTCSGTALTCAVTMNGAKTVTANFSRAYILNASAAPVAGGRVTGGGSYQSGTSVPVTATPNAGYILTGWTGSGACSGSGPTCTVAMNRDKTVTANFSREFTLITAPSPADGGDLTGAGVYVSGSSVTVVATPSPGYALTGWTGGEACSSAVLTCQVTMDGDKAVAANFSPKFTLTANAAPSVGGTVTGGGSYPSGTSVPVTAAPNAGYTLSGWTGTGACSGTVLTCLVTMNGAKSVTANFSSAFILTTDAAPSAGGTVTGGGSYPSSAEVAVTAAANAGYGFASWSGACDGVVTNPCTVTMDGAKSVTANFAQPGFELTTSVNLAAGGSISASGRYAPGTIAGVVAAPSAGYILTGWTGTGACSGADLTCLVTMDGAKSVTANFSSAFTLTTNAAPSAGGTVIGGGSYPFSAEVAVTAVANAGYGFASWSGACDGVVANPCTVTMDGAKSVTANFAQPGFELTTSVNSAAGGSISASGRYAPGTIAGVVAAPSAGYILTGWTGSGACSGADLTCLVTMNGAKTVTANFAQEFTLATNAAPPAGGTVTSGGNYPSGEVVALTATPNSHYVFTNWSGDCSGTVPTCLATMNGNKSVTANFSIAFTLTTSVAPSAGGTVTSGGSHSSGASVPVRATLNAGYRLIGWNIGPGVGVSCEQPAPTLTCTVIMDSDLTVRADFSSEFTLTTAPSPAGGGSLTGAGSYVSGTPVDVVATPSLGYTLTGWTGGEACSSLDLECRVIMDGNKTVAANFSLDLLVQFTLTTNAVPVAGGTVIGGGSHPSGAAVNVIAIPNPDYGLNSWTGACDGVGAVTNPCAVIMDADMDVTANFSLSGLELTTSVNPAVGGSISSGGRYALGTIAGVVATPNAGYTLSGWTGTGSGACPGAAPTCTVTMVRARSVTANFSLSLFELTTSASPAAGGVITVSPQPGVGGYPSGTTVSVDVTQNKGYTLTGWTVTGGGACPGTPLTCDVTMDETKKVTANFSQDFNLAANANPLAGGTVTGGGVQASGISASITASANPGYTFTDWSGDCSGTVLTCTVTMDQDKTATANFSQDFNLIANANPLAGGTVTGGGVQTSGTASITQSANAGYTFQDWSGDCSGTAPTCTVDMDGDKTVTANFSQEFNLAANANPLAGGTVTGGGVQASGISASITASANPGYTFKDWSGDCSGTVLTCTVTMDQDKTVTANFSQAPVTWTLTTIAYPDVGGDISPATGEHSANTSVAVTYTANRGYTFTGWSGGSCSGTEVCNVYMDSSKTVTASFSVQVAEAVTDKIAFASDRSGDMEIYVMDYDGSNKTRLTTFFGIDEYPSLSPDGSKIAFAHYGSEFSLRNNHDIYIMDSDGSNLTRLASTLSSGQTESTDYHPSWSPDGSKIFFSSHRDGNYEIYSMNTDGSNQTRITDTSSIHKYRPSVSPDGRKIVYRTGGAANQIWVIDIDGSNPSQLTFATRNYHPSWNHDGSMIAFSSYRDGVTSIYTMNADGTNQSRVTVLRDAAQWPVWSPDGTKIIYQDTENSNTDIRIIGADGSGDTRLTDDPASDKEPSTWRTILAVAEDPVISEEPPDSVWEIGQLSFPRDVVMASDGNIYVADSASHSIKKFTSEGDLVLKIGKLGAWSTAQGTGDGEFVFPFSVAVAPDGNLYVVDKNNNRIQKFDPDGVFLRKWGTPGTGNGEFNQPTGVAVASNGTVYVADKGNNRIQYFTANGDFLGKWGNLGSGDGDFNTPDPRGVAVAPNGNVYVVDSYGYRIQYFTANGVFIGKWGDLGSADGEFLRPKGIAVASDGSVYVADTHNHRIQKFTANGDFISKWGSQGDGQGQFESPRGVAVAPNGNVYVADTENGRIQKFGATEEPVTGFTLDTTAVPTAGGNLTGGGDYPPDTLVTVTATPSAGYTFADANWSVDLVDCESKTFDAATLVGTCSVRMDTNMTVTANFSQAPATRVISMSADADPPEGGTVIVSAPWLTPVQDTNSWEGDCAVSTDGAPCIITVVATPSDGYTFDGWSEGCTSTSTGTGTCTITVGANDSNKTVTASFLTEGPVTSPDAPVFDREIRTSAEVNGELSWPRDVAVASDGSIYVTDSGGNRIQKFDSDGVFLSKWGGWGQGDGEFETPNDVAVAPEDDSVYVSDSQNHRIQKFNSDGDFLSKWGTEGSDDRQFQRPLGVAVGPNGNVYVADTSNHRIQKFTPQGAFVKKWGTRGSADGQFRSPNDVAVGPNGNVYVADTLNYRIQEFSSDGVFVSEWGGYGAGDGQFNEPRGIAVADGSVYVVDAQNHRIQKFDPDGVFDSEWGTRGTGDGEFEQPLGVEVASDGSVYVADTYNNRIQVFANAVD